MSKSLIFFFAFFLFSCSTPKLAKPWSRSALVFGNIPFTLTVYENKDNGLFEEAFELLDNLDRKMSVWGRPFETELTKLSHDAGIAPLRISDDTLAVLKASLDFAYKTEGALNVALGPLVQLWGIATDHPQVPKQEKITELLSLTNLKDIQIEGSSVFLKRQGMSLDFGGIAKGYACDQVVELLKKRAVRSAIVDIGGNIFVMGGKPSGKDTLQNWHIGVQAPNEPRGTAIGVIKAQDTCLATSGIYERNFSDPQTGKTYHHLLDPQTGWPADNELTSLSIIGKSSIACDAYGKLLILGLKQAAQKILETPDLQAILITKDHRVYITSELAQHFTLTHDKYTLHPLSVD